MMTAKREYKMHDGKIGAAITVQITPRSTQNQLKKILEDGTLQINLLSSKGDDEHNRMLIEFLANIFGTKSGDIEIIAGLKGPDKLVTILNIDAETIQKRILAQLNTSSETDSSR